jgi:hypothetical protein
MIISESRCINILYIAGGKIHLYFVSLCNFNQRQIHVGYLKQNKRTKTGLYERKKCMKVSAKDYYNDASFYAVISFSGVTP